MAPFAVHLWLGDSKGTDEQQEPTSCWSSMRIRPLQLFFFTKSCLVPFAIIIADEKGVFNLL